MFMSKAGVSFHDIWLHTHNILYEGVYECRRPVCLSTAGDNM